MRVDFLFGWFLRQDLLCGPGWPGNLTILLPQPTECWNYRHEPPHPTFDIFLRKPMTLETKRFSYISSILYSANLNNKLRPCMCMCVICVCMYEHMSLLVYICRVQVCVHVCGTQRQPLMLLLKSHPHFF